MPHLRRLRGNQRGIADSAIGYAVLGVIIFVFGYFSPQLVKRMRGAAKEAGGLKADFESGYREAAAPTKKS